MAKKAEKKGVNKSKIIRDYKAAHDEEGPTAIAAAVSKQLGEEISVQYVSTVLSQAKRRAGGKAAGAKRGRPAKSAEGVTIDDLKKAAALIKAIGADRARDAINLLGGLVIG